MRFIELKDALKDFTIFSLRDIEGIGSKFHRRRLNEWQDKGYIRKILRSYYIFSDLKLNENILFDIANRIYAPSYVSFEMALSYHNLIPESVYVVTSATTRRTYSFKTPIARFIYHTLKKELFFGYELIKYNGRYFSIAAMEKAILDYLYINPGINSESDFESLRLNSELFLQKLDENKLYSFAEKYCQKKLLKRMNNLMRFMKNA